MSCKGSCSQVLTLLKTIFDIFWPWPLSAGPICSPLTLQSPDLSDLITVNRKSAWKSDWFKNRSWRGMPTILGVKWGVIQLDGAWNPGEIRPVNSQRKILKNSPRSSRAFFLKLAGPKQKNLTHFRSQNLIRRNQKPKRNSGTARTVVALFPETATGTIPLEICHNCKENLNFKEPFPWTDLLKTHTGFGDLCL